jgi:amino acid transporter
MWRWVLGRPLKSREAQSEEISTPLGLAALSLDALSSVAYGPEAIALVLVGAGMAAMRLLLPVTLAIVALLLLLVLSYTQVIAAYPAGGGAYAVSRDNLGPAASKLAGASLIVDYVLTVAVSIAAGVDVLTSAFPALLLWTVPICLVILAVITVLNLRGVGESARAFLLPTLAFIGGTLAVIVVGFTHSAPLAVVRAPVVRPTVEVLGILLILKAFAAGCTALTGVEAIANGVPLFRPPRQVRAMHTEWLLGLILAVMLVGLAILTVGYHLLPRANVTLLSQVTAAAVGRSWLFYVASLSTTVVLGLAANTSFGGLPLLASVLAKDHLVPHVFAVRGDRLVYDYGVWVLAAAAALLLVVSAGNTQALIPLYAIGVFTGFTLAQAGMVMHWLRERGRHFELRAGLNGLGAVASGAATLVFVISKFTAGAWVVVITVPLLIFMFGRIEQYYRRTGEMLHPPGSLPEVVPLPRPLVVVPITGDFSTLTARALSHALELSDQVVALTVLFDDEAGPDAEERLYARWKEWGVPARLVVVRSQYHSVVRPVLRFIGTLERRAGERVWVLIPEVVPTGFGHALLHNHVGRLLSSALAHRTDLVVGTVPFHIEDPVPRSPTEPES